MSELRVVPQSDGRTHYSSDFARGARVHVDGDKSLVAVVCGHQFRENYSTCEISWFVNGDLKTQCVEEWRLSRA
jgi:hypothetical protein